MRFQIQWAMLDGFKLVDGGSSVFGELAHAVAAATELARDAAKTGLRLSLTRRMVP